MLNFENKELPDWFKKPNPFQFYQPCLFKTQLSSILPNLNVTLSEMQRWRDFGWLSFDPLVDWEVDDCGDPIVNEIEFIRDIAHSGVPESRIERLLSELSPPFNYDPRRIAYSFQYGWVMAAIPEDPEEIIRENLGEWLNEIEDSELASLLVQITDILAKRHRSDS